MRFSAAAAALRSAAVRRGAHHSPRSSARAQGRRGIGVGAQSGQRVDDGFVQHRHGAARRRGRRAPPPATARRALSRRPMISRTISSRAGSVRLAAAIDRPRTPPGCRSGRWRGRLALHLRVGVVRAAARARFSASLPPKMRSRSTAVRRTAGFVEFFSGSTARRPSAPNEISSSRMRRMVWVWSSVDSASANGSTRRGPIAWHSWVSDCDARRRSPCGTGRSRGAPAGRAPACRAPSLAASQQPARRTRRLRADGGLVSCCAPGMSPSSERRSTSRTREVGHAAPVLRVGFDRASGRA